LPEYINDEFDAFLEYGVRAHGFLRLRYADCAHEKLVASTTTLASTPEIRTGEIRRLVTEQGCPSPNQMKSFARCGMGPCQGRLCGLTVVELIAESRGVPVSEVGYYRIRSPVKPVTVGELAGLGLDR